MDKPATVYANAPALPQEPAQRSQSWVKWMILGLLLAAIGGGVLLARNMGAFPGLGGSPSKPAASTADPVDKNAISAEDKAKADLLVGPQGQGSTTSTATTPGNDPSVVTINPSGDNASPAPAAPVGSAGTVSTAAPAPVMPEPPPVNVPVTQPTVANTTPDIGGAPNPVPARAPKPPQRTPAPARSGGPSLDDLLD